MEEKLCQCPQRASTHFFIGPVNFESLLYKCVNALNGLLLISSIDKPGDINFEESVNALNGLLLISSTAAIFGWGKYQMCQCPQRASTHFFERKCPAQEKGKWCQCPQRASTHFFSCIV